VRASLASWLVLFIRAGSLQEFHTFDHAYFSLLGMLLGGGVTYAELAEANAVGAPLLYVPFTIFFAFVVLQMVVALIIEAYQVHQAHRVRLVGLWHQVGGASSVRACLPVWLVPVLFSCACLSVSARQGVCARQRVCTSVCVRVCIHR
jgi:hypothetical protein